MCRGLSRGWAQGDARCSGQTGRCGRRRRLKGKRRRGTLDTEKPPIFGMIPRGGDVVIRLLETGHQVTSKPLSQATSAPGPGVYTVHTTARTAWDRGATSLNVSVTVVVHRLGMTTAMAFMTCTSTRGKAFGPSCGQGGVHSVASRKTIYRCLWDASNLFLTGDDEAKYCWEPYLISCSRSSPERELSQNQNTPFSQRLQLCSRPSSS
jgi:hypothetical protein